MRKGSFSSAVLFLALTGSVWCQGVDELFSGAGLPELRLEMEPGDWQKLHDNYQDKKTNYPATFRWNGQVVSPVGVHTRGSGSLNPIKPGLAIEFGKFVPGQTFQGFDSFILRNFAEDPSMMHETLAMRVFERLGLPFQKTAHVALYVNNTFAGLFELAEPIDSRYLRIRFGEDRGVLYEAQGGKDFAFQYLGDAASTYVPAMFGPKTQTANPQGEVIAQWVRAMNLSTDAEFTASMARYTDLGAFVTYAAVEVFLSEVDGLLSTSGMTNFYLYRRGADNRFIFLPWDKEMTFARLEWPLFEGAGDNVLLRRALQVPELRQRYLDTMHLAAEAIGGPGGWLDSEIAHQYSLIREAAAADPSRVCLMDGATAPCPLESFYQGVEYLHKFGSERAAFIEAEISQQGWQMDPYVPRVAIQGTRNAASGAAVLAPGTIAFIAVQLQTSMEERAESWPLPVSLGGISVRIGDVAAPILMGTADGIWVQTPTELPGGAASLVVSDVMGSSITSSVEIRAASPGIFSITHADGSLVSEENPAQSGEPVSAWATGLGRAVSDDSSGTPAPTNRLVTLKAPINAMIGGQTAQVAWAGLVPGYAGLQQVNLIVPDLMEAGFWPIRLAAGEVLGAVAFLPVR